MKLLFKNFVFLLILVFPSLVLGKTFTNCGGDFNFFLNEAEKHAAELGVSSEVLRKTIRQTKFNPKIIELDRKQRSFKLSFLEANIEQRNGVYRMKMFLFRSNKIRFFLSNSRFQSILPASLEKNE